LREESEGSKEGTFPKIDWAQIPREYLCVRVLKLIVVRDAILYGSVQQRKGHENHGIVWHDFQDSFLDFSCCSRVVQLLFGTDFKVLEEGRVVQQYEIFGHIFQGKKLG
jgi:hypothetical protein